MLRLKVCGLNNEENIRRISSLEPDYIGLNFYWKSKRFVTKDFNISNTENVQLVGVFVNDGLQRIFDLSKKYTLNYIQLHGDESPEFCECLLLHDLKIIKVFRVDEKFSFKEVEPFLGKADFFLFDAAGKDYGGNGKAFNWDILKKYPYDTPYFLAGGLNPENVNEVLNTDLPMLYGLDVNSGYELEPGIKDEKKIKELLKKIR